MARAIWTRDGMTVKRYARIIACIVKVKGHGYGWTWPDSTNVERYGFDKPDDILEDVKYFHRYNPPRLKVFYRSGRTVEFR